MTAPTQYHDFRLALERKNGKTRCALLWSPVGRAEEEFQETGTVTRDRPNERQDAEKVGSALFEVLFAGKIGDKYRRSLDLLRHRQDQGLRVRLLIDPHLAEAGDWLEEPWEILYDPEDRRFLSRSAKTTFVRDPEAPLPLRPLVDEPPPRILVAISKARPKNGAEIDVDKELDRIREAWNGAAEVEMLHPVDLRALRRRLKGNPKGKKPFHVLHFVGHGGISRERGEGFLLFDGPDGGSMEVLASELADAVRDIPTLRLAVLNACSTAEIPSYPEQDPTRSVALALVGSGLAAVVANRAPIDTNAATLFAEELHRELAADTPIDAAIAEARMAVHEADLTFEQWRIPVLYLSSPDGKIFDFPQPSASRSREATTGPVPLRLAIRSFAHPFDDLAKDCDHLLDLLPSFDGREIRDPKDWKEIVKPQVESFLGRYVTTRRPLELRLDAHLTVAFTAGYAIETRGVEITLRQATMGGFQNWKLEPGRKTYQNLWCFEEIRKPEWLGEDVAVAVSVSRNARAGAMEHLLGEPGSPASEPSTPGIKLLLTAQAHPAPSNDVVRDAAHAFAMAQELVRKLTEIRNEHGWSTLHVYLSAPVGFAFFFGQLCRVLGDIQLYEWMFDKQNPTYQASLTIEARRRAR